MLYIYIKGESSNLNNVRRLIAQDELTSIFQTIEQCMSLGSDSGSVNTPSSTITWSSR